MPHPIHLWSWSVCSRDTCVHFFVATQSTRLAFTMVAEQRFTARRAMRLRRKADEDADSPVGADVEVLHGLADDFAVEVPRWNQWQSWRGGNGGTWPQWGRADCSDPPDWLGPEHCRLWKRMANRHSNPSQGGQGPPLPQEEE